MKNNTMANLNIKDQDKKNNFLDKLSYIKNNIFKNKVFLIGILIILGLILIIFLFNNKKPTQTPSQDSVVTYIKNLEEKLESTLSKVEGAGNIDVLITVESGMETIYASKITTTEYNGKIEREETPIIVNGKTVTIKENYPKISGVLLVVEGANNIFVLSKIQDATVSLLNIDINKIQILKMK